MRRYNQAFQELYDSVITHHAHAANMRGEVTVSTWLRFNLCVYVFFNISYLAPAEVQGSTEPCQGADCTLTVHNHFISKACGNPRSFGPKEGVAGADSDVRSSFNHRVIHHVLFFFLYCSPRCSSFFKMKKKERTTD